ncbi:heme/hemin ABC transporter substrate-binding protein [Paracoccus aerodenitrificans]|uniref:heme/hemin ABC transporter substrate-binding protein n=1 Tax=Paracoccus aerodenitrificans TaxID=3017781 RepID=UPI0022F0DE32|nr:ABC transporter substrate-binding protein [Paracoccus aerodenitrificans]WBU65117.1 ABC transporter substrate-binding protein [Paracoccus aerodenitrificans]
MIFSKNFSTIPRAIAASLLATVLLNTPSHADPHPEARRILSVGGSITEIVYALGQQDRLIARDTTSSFPEEALALPDVGYMRQLSAEGVLSVDPDLILSEEGAGPPETISLLQEAGVPFEIMPSGMGPHGLVNKVRAIAETLGVPEAAEQTVNTLEADLANLQAAVASDSGEKKKVLFVLFVTDGRINASGTGTAADEIIHMAGAENAVQDFEGYKQLTDEAITAAAPDIILTMTRGGPAEELDPKAEELLAMPSISTTPAGRDGNIITMNGLYLLGFGPRTGKAGLELHDAIYGNS